VLHVHEPEAAAARSLSDRAYYRIRELIVTLELAPGSVVDERALMERLGLGRTPIREALRTLQRERLVEVFPRRGLIVPAINVGDLATLTEVRASLEAQAAALAAERATVVDRTRVIELLVALETATHGERALIDLDQRLHRAVWEAAHNPFLSSTLEEYYVKTLRIWFLALDRVVELGDSIGEHRALLIAIRDQDPPAAAGAARRHVANFERAVRAVL